MAKRWIQSAIHREGALREYFGVKEGQNIPEAKLDSLINRLQKKSEEEKLSEKELRLLRQALLARRLRAMHK